MSSHSHAHAALLPHQEYEYAVWNLVSARRAVAFGGCRHRRCGCVRSGATYNNGGTPSTSDNTRTATWKCAAGMRSFHPGTAAELGSKLCSGGRQYWDAMLRFAALRGLTLIKVNLDGGLLPHKTRPGTLCIARGSSPRGNHAHVTVAMVTCDGRALELAHDPHPTGDRLAGEPSWAAFFVPASRFT